MKVVILYRPKSEHSTAVESFVHDYQIRHGSARLELVNVDEREGIALARLYDIVSYPAILAMAADGTLLHMWADQQLPLMDEVASYMVER
ncbi:MAG TPA: hypothetical protein VF575_00140 [Candidatus Saccharimonadales bacterium]|jgi:hypothetical protein